MFNILYDVPTGSALRPYIGVGIGISHITDKLNIGILKNENKSNNSLAYQGILGVSYQITPKIKAMIDYRYLATAKKVLKDGRLDDKSPTGLQLIKDITSSKEAISLIKKSYYSSSAMIGLSYSFGSSYMLGN
ncbi:MAG: P44/Msp2 family outer membrane protein, partial [Mycoplasmataceae bacterium]|jgi:opacity protein-like surface antigen|nr:P44/Msp2 family outer membrane protein [Mycoplasmataceae bacterium]